MTTSTAATTRLPRVRSSSALAYVSHLAPVHSVSTIVNQPLTVVWAHLRSVTHGKEGATVESDPTLEAVHLSWGSPIGVRYTGYEVPGGAQVEAWIACPGHGRLNPLTGLAVRVIRRRVAGELSRMRDELE